MGVVWDLLYCRTRWPWLKDKEVALNIPRPLIDYTISWVRKVEQAALSLYRDREGIAQFFLEEGWFARVTDPAIMYSYL